MNGHYEIGETVLGSWTLARLIGEGSYGKVYEAHREDFGISYTAAVKIITIPQSKSEIINARSEGMDDESVTSYFRSFVEEIVQEFALMSRLKGTANVVSYEDHAVIPHDCGIGWDILIRMELLTPLLDYSVNHMFTRKDVIQLGIDLCRALELCQKYNIVHRDIKPENIFLSELGDFKLGDFGIARTVEKTTGGLSKKGTYTYMAPEVYREEPYNSTVDIYSLGIVLYRLLNDNRAPFLPESPAPITHSSRETALMKRISGADIPVPKNADGHLAEIVLKACAFNPKDRYFSPVEMRHDLEAIQYHHEETSVIYPKGSEVTLHSVHNIPTEPSQTTESKEFLFENTESFFGEQADKEKVERTSGVTIALEKTESIFGTAAALDAAPYSATAQQSQVSVADDESEAFRPARNKKKWLIPATVAVVVLALIGGFILSRNNTGNHTSEAIYRDNGNLGCLFNYDRRGNLISEEQYDEIGNLDYKALYHYNKKDCFTSIERYDNLGELLFEIVYVYDNNGNLISEETYNGPERVFRQKWVYSYDVPFRIADTNHYKYDEVYRECYDKFGNCILRESMSKSDLESMLKTPRTPQKSYSS